MAFLTNPRNYTPFGYRQPLIVVLGILIFVNLLLPLLLDLATGVSRFESRTLNMSGLDSQESALPFRDDFHRAATGIEATKQLYHLSAQTYYGSFYSAIDSPEEMSTVLNDNLVWLWPVNTRDEEVALLPTSLGWRFRSRERLPAGKVEIRRSWGAVTGMSWDYTCDRAQSTGIFGSWEKDQRKDAILAVMLPLQLWMHRAGAIPTSYAQVLNDLQIRPIEGRLGALVAPGGPVVIYRHPDQRILEARFDTGGAMYVRVDVTEGGWSSRVQFNAKEDSAFPIPGREDWPVWATIDADAVGSPIAGRAIQAAEETEFDFPKLKQFRSGL